MSSKNIFSNYLNYLVTTGKLIGKVCSYRNEESPDTPICPCLRGFIPEMDQLRIFFPLEVILWLELRLIISTLLSVTCHWDVTLLPLSADCRCDQS